MHTYILLTHLLLWHVNLHSEIINLTFRAIQECRAMKSLKLFTKLKYCAAHVQSKTDRGLMERDPKEDMPSYCSHPQCCYRGSIYRVMVLQWPLVAENKSSVKTDGGEIPLSQPLSLLKRAEKGIMCWNSLQICGRVTPTLVKYFPCFQAGRLQFGQTC